MPRSRKLERAYVRYRRKQYGQGCVFCAIQPGSSQLIRQTKFFKVIKNLFPYSIWDSLSVANHLMIVPIEHSDSLSDLSDEAVLEYMNLIREYEAQGYNFYYRPANSKVKSVVHQHTHLIKTTGKPKKFILSLRWPFYLMISRG